MKKIFSKLLDKIKMLKNKGFFEIFISTFINKSLSLLTTFILVRVLTKDEYGVFTYAFNLVSIIMIFSSLGLDTAMLQFASEKKEPAERLPIYKFCFFGGGIANVATSLVIVVYALFMPLSMEAGRYAFLFLAIYNVFQFLFRYITIYFRVQLNNRKYAILTNINSLFYLLLASVGAYYLRVNGTILGRYAAFLITLLVGFLLIFKELKSIRLSQRIDKKERTTIIKYGLTIVLTNSISEILYYIDIVVIGFIIGTSISIAEYKTATTIPFALNAVPLIIITFIYPYFAKNKDNYIWIRTNYRKVLLACMLMNLLISITGFIFTEQIITLVFGKDYLASATCFRILMIGFFFSGTFRTISGNVIAMMRKVKINLIVDTITSAINIVADIILVYNFGSVGAAIASLSVVIISGLLSTLYLEIYLHNRIKASNSVTSDTI